MKPEFPNASSSFRRLNPELFDPDSTGRDQPVREVCPAVAEPDVCHEPVGPVPGAPSRPTKFLLSVTVCRVRLIDPENVSTKHIAGDCLQAAGAISQDDAATIELRVSQKKVKTKEEEGTLIELKPLYD